MTKDEKAKIKYRMRRLAGKFCRRNRVEVFTSCVRKLIEKAYLTSYLQCLHENKNKIAALEKENAKLKEDLEHMMENRNYWMDSSFDWRHKCMSKKSVRVAAKAQTQLRKAKEIIKKIEKIFYSGESAIKRLSKISDVLMEAEQFLQE